MEISPNYVKQIQTKGLNPEMIQKDLALSYILQELSNTHFQEYQLIFKGGTLLSKSILNYHRLSEDLDFTLYLKHTTSKSQRKKHSKQFIKEQFIPTIQKIAQKYGFIFSNDIETTNKFCKVKSSHTLYWFELYISSNHTNPIKIEISIDITLQYKPIQSRIYHLNLKSHYLTYPLHEYTILSYTLEEIILEKFRAILTREILSERDYFDLYIIHTTKMNIFSLNKSAVIQKIKESIHLEETLNFQEKIITLTPLQEIQTMSLINFDTLEYYDFCNTINTHILQNILPYVSSNPTD